MLNQTNKTLAILNQNYGNRHADTYKRVGSDELTSVQEFGRYLAINVICLGAIMFIMSFCYMSHVFYNNVWKPFSK